MYNHAGFVQNRKGVSESSLYKFIQNDPLCDRALRYYRHAFWFRVGVFIV